MACSSNLSPRGRYFFKFVFSWLLQKRMKVSANKSEPHTSKEVGCPSTNGETMTEYQQWLWQTHYSRQNRYVTLSRGRHSVTWKKKRRDANFPEDILKTHLFTSQPTNCDSWTIEAKNISWPCCCGKSPGGSFYTLPKLTNLGIVGHSVKKKQSSETSQICRCRWKW